MEEVEKGQNERTEKKKMEGEEKDLEECQEREEK